MGNYQWVYALYLHIHSLHPESFQVFMDCLLYWSFDVLDDVKRIFFNSSFDISCPKCLVCLWSAPFYFNSRIFIHIHSCSSCPILDEQSVRSDVFFLSQHLPICPSTEVTPQDPHSKRCTSILGWPKINHLFLSSFSFFWGTALSILWKICLFSIRTSFSSPVKTCNSTQFLQVSPWIQHW